MRRSPRRSATAGDTVRHRLPVLVALSWLAASAHPAIAQPSFNMELVAHLPLSTCTDVSSQGDLVFLGRSQSGVSILDLSDPTDPSELATWTHPTLPMAVNDPRPLGNHLYVSNETGDTSGLFALDISVPSTPVLVSAMGPPDFPLFVHNLITAGNHVYTAGYGEAGGNAIIDVSDPANPELASNIAVGIHDHFLDGTTLHISGGLEGSYLYDVSDPTAPVELATYNPNTPDTLYYAHNSALITGTSYVLLGEEVQRLASTPGWQQGGLRIVDYTDPGAPFTAGRWHTENAKNNDQITTHNIYIIGDIAYVSYYQDGVRILDLADPLDPVEVGWYDTFPSGAITLFQGCWGVDPSQGDDRIYASDRSNGFFVLSYNGARRSTVSGTVRDAATLDPIAGAAILSVTANRSTATDAAGDYALRTGSGLHTFEVSAAGYITALDQLDLADFGALTHDVLLSSNGVGIDDAGTPAAPAVLRLAEAAPNPLNPTTTLRFDVPGDGAGLPYELAIFDVRGARVRVLESGAAAAGEHALLWDGTGDSGRSVASGLYFLRLEVGNDIATTKIVVAR